MIDRYEVLQRQLKEAVTRAEAAEQELVARRIGSLNRHTVVAIMACDGLVALLERAAKGDIGSKQTVDPLLEAMEAYRHSKSPLLLPGAVNGHSPRPGP